MAADSSTSPEPSRGVQRAICDGCGARGSIEPGQIRICAECGAAYRPMALLEGLVDRWLAPEPQHISEFYPRHLKLIELLWTADGRGRETYEALGPQKVSYGQFITRATQIVVRGLAEGWIEVDLPTAPTTDDTAYQVRFVDPERWADELTSTFAPRTSKPSLAPGAAPDP